MHGWFCQQNTCVPLRFDDGTTIKVEVDAVPISFCPFNLLSPQLVITALKKASYHVYNFEHNNAMYKFNVGINPQCMSKMSVNVSNNNLFLFWSNPGYQSFFAQAAAYNDDFAAFAWSAINVSTAQQTVQASLHSDFPTVDGMFPPLEASFQGSLVQQQPNSCVRTRCLKATPNF